MCMDCQHTSIINCITHGHKSLYKEFHTCPYVA